MRWGNSWRFRGSGLPRQLILPCGRGECVRQWPAGRRPEVKFMSTVSPKQVKPQGRRLSGKPRSIRQAQALQAVQLRSQGRTWAEVATVFRTTYRVNPRVALRQAHGWSQPQAAEQWTVRWPDDPKSFKNFSYWEQWPSQTGH